MDDGESPVNVETFVNSWKFTSLVGMNNDVFYEINWGKLHQY